MAAKGVLRTVLCKVGFDATDSEKQIKAFNDQLKQTEKQYKNMAKAGSDMTKVFTTSFLGLIASLVLMANSELKAAEETGQLSKSMQEYSESLNNMNSKLANTKTQFLEACLPIMTQVVDIFTTYIIPILEKAIALWNALPEGVQKFIVVIALLLAIIGPLLTVMSKCGTAFNVIIGFLYKAAIAGTAANASLGPLLLTLLGIAVALAIILGMSGKFDSMFDSIKTGISDIHIGTSDNTAKISSSQVSNTQNNTININSVNPNYDANLTAEILNRQLGGELG